MKIYHIVDPQLSEKCQPKGTSGTRMLQNILPDTFLKQQDIHTKTKSAQKKLVMQDIGDMADS